MSIRALVRAAVAVALMLVGLSVRAEDVSPLLDQNWTKDKQTAWYEASQGSRLIPLSWLKALELAGSGQKAFLDDDHITALRYLPRDMATQPGLRLPIGFTVDVRNDDELLHTKLRWKAGQSKTEPWVGMTCSACHTTAITYKDKSMIVDGGSTLADFQTFIEHLNDSLVATRDDAARFSRFAGKVLEPQDQNTEDNRRMLKEALGGLLDYQLALAKLNQTDLRYGFGRLDAVGHIMNKIAFLAKAPNARPNPSDAPVSFPFLWGTPKHDRVEWNLVAKNSMQTAFDIGALGRNTGEVIGVFGDVVPRANPGLISGFVSSADVSNIIAHEHLLSSLQSPKWPDTVFGVPSNDPKTGVARGRQLFETHCQDCHKTLSRTDLTTKVEVNASMINRPHGPANKFGPLGTDPWMACNTIQFRGPTGMLKGLKDSDGKELGEEALLVNMLTATIQQVLLNRKGELAGQAIGGFVGYHPSPKPAPSVTWLESITAQVQEAMALSSEKERRKKECLSLPDDGQARLIYKGRPLNGIWATAPYLHNGSVPTLYDLLLPPKDRPAKFNLGTREFDPERVGYLTAPRADNPFVFDTTKEGNSNAGHDYGSSSLTPEDRKALVEYMKTL
jgi:hypothetical protein